MAGRAAAGERPSPSVRALRATSLVGAVLFSVGFAVLMSRPAAAERRAHDSIVEEVTNRASAFLQMADSIPGDGLLGALAAPFSDEADALRARVERDLAERLADILADMCHYCDEGGTADPVDETAADRTDLFGQASGITTAWAQERYSETVIAVIRDLRIFAGLNAVLFILVLAASLTSQPRSRGVYAVMLWLVLLVTTASVIGYLFVQDWFYAALDDRYVGFGYAAWVAVVFLLLADWLFNRGRLSETLVRRLGLAGNGRS